MPEPSRVPQPSRSTLKQVFIVSLARSGSTLLRYLLDAHPAITSPPELNLSALLEHSVDTWHRANEALAETEDDDGAARREPAPEAYRFGRKVVDEIMLRYARRTGASVFVDKSLTTVDQLRTVSRCYPKAHFIFLYRYPLDLIASGIEASRWGFNAFGFAPYVGMTPGNFIAGLGNYWIDKTSKMVEFERTCTVAHARIYYELLCDAPEDTLASLVEFLDLEPDEALTTRAFASDHGKGPGDYKVDFTHEVGAASIGRGSSLPPHLGPEQIRRIDELLAELDYPSVEAARRGDLAALLGLKRRVRAAEDSSAIESVTRRIADTFAAGLDACRGAEAAALPGLEVAVIGDGGDQRVIVIADGSVTVADTSDSGPAGAERPRVLAAGDVLLRAVAGELNLAQASHDRDLRVLLGDTEATRPATHKVLSQLNLLIRRAQLGPSAGPTGPMGSTGRDEMDDLRPTESRTVSVPQLVRGFPGRPVSG